MKPGASIGRIPASVSLAARASVTAGLANDVRDGDARERPRHQSHEIDGHVPPREAALAGVGQGHSGVEVRAAYRAERQNEGDEASSGRDRVGE